MDEYAWDGYLQYLRDWADEHQSEKFAGMTPACYEEWEDNEGTLMSDEDSEIGNYPIYFQDLNEATQKDLLELWGENGNYDVIPIVELPYYKDVNHDDDDEGEGWSEEQEL